MKKRKTKVTYIISFIDKAIAFEWIATYLNKEEFELSFVLLNPGSSFLGDYLKKNNIKVHEIKYLGKRDIITASFFLGNILLRNRPDVIHTHLVDADLIGLIVGWIFRINKRVYTRHNANYHRKYHKGAEKYDRLSNFLSTHIVSISKNISSILIKEENVDPKKIRLVYHGFDLSRFENVTEKEKTEIFQKYNPNFKRPVIGVISRYMHWKGIQFIIPAFKKLLEEYPNALLVLANAKKGDYTKEINELLLELPLDSFHEIEFENNLFALYQLFDLFVHVPIDKEVEAFGQIYVEVLAAGIPSVVTNSGIANEFIISEENAIVVDYQNSTDVFESVSRLLKDKKLQNVLIKNGKNSVEAVFNLEKMIHKLEKLYSE